MPKFAANLSFLFQELPFLERFAAAAAHGFQAVEYLFPYDHPADVIADQLKRHGLQQILFNCPPGDWGAGERGIAILSHREQEFLSGLQQALTYAKTLDCTRLHVMAGILSAGDDAHAAQRQYRKNLKRAAQMATDSGCVILIEPINRRDMPEYFLANYTLALELIAEIGAPNLKLQYDLYHAQIIEGDLVCHLRTYLPHIGHIQIANPPDRHEPNCGEINYAFLFEMIDALGYQGWIGCEYRPKNTTSDSLSWARPYGIG